MSYKSNPGALPGLVVLLIIFGGAGGTAQNNSNDVLAGQHRVGKSRPSALKENRIDAGSFVEIPAGAFDMGSNNGSDDEKPVHNVRITKPFELGKCEVTQEQWQAVMGSNPSRSKGANKPVERVSWDDVQEFIKKLNAKNDGYTYRLPTEAEWEYACRAGSSGDYAGDPDEMAWCDKEDYAATTPHPVGQKKPNAWGLHDMHGNLWEWCSDFYSKDYYKQSPSSDPTGPSKGFARVVRGGNWSASSPRCRSALRYGDSPVNISSGTGFRLVRSSGRRRT